MSVSWRLHGACWRLCTKVKSGERKAPTVSAWSPKGVFTSACAQILVAIPDSYPWRKEVLPIAHGLWTRCSTIYHAGYCFRLHSQKMDIWVDARSLATGAWWNCHGGCELVTKGERHAAHKLGRAWCCAKRYKHGTDVESIYIASLHWLCVCVHKWITGTLTGNAGVHTRLASEMLIRQQLDALASLVEEYGLSVNAGQNITERIVWWEYHSDG